MIELKCNKKLEDTNLTFGNQMGYILEVDGIPVIRYNVDFHRRIKNANLFYKAEIEYENLFSNEQNSKYTNKGYTKIGLNLLCNEIFKNNLTPYIYLSINNDNEISKHVALSSGFKQVDNETFCIYHPNAINMYKEAIKILQEKGYTDLYNSEINKFSELVNNEDGKSK